MIKTDVRFLSYKKNGLNKILRMNVVDFGKKSIWVFSQTCITTITGLILTYALANNLPKEDFGIYKYVVAFTAIASSFSLTGLSVVIIRRVAKEIQNPLRDAFHKHLSWSTGVFFVVICAAFYHYAVNQYTVALCILFFGLIYPVSQGFGLYESLLIGSQEIKKSSQSKIILTITTAVTVVATLNFTQNILAVVSLLALLTLIVNAYFYFSVKQKYTNVKKLNIEDYQYSKHLSAMSVLSGTANHIDQIAVFYFLGPVNLAIYSIALTVPQKLKGSFFGLKNIIMPKLAQMDVPQIKKAVPQKVLLFFIFLSLIAIAYSCVAPLLFEVLFPDYAEAVVYTQTLSLLIVFTSILPLRQTFLAHAHKKELYITEITIPAVKIILTLILIPWLGLWGAITSLLLTRLYATIITTFLFIRLK